MATWAENYGSMMQRNPAMAMDYLPGRMAARANGGRYNQWNAIGDIIGAYLANQGAATPQAGSQMGANTALIRQNISNFLPSTDWLGAGGQSPAVNQPGQSAVPVINALSASLAPKQETFFPYPNGNGAAW